jgi:hypothetical protein
MSGKKQEHSKGPGVTSAAMKQHGRNLARAMNQKQKGPKSGGRGR